MSRYNVCYINEENEMINHENITFGKVVELVAGLNVVESLTIVWTGASETGDKYDDPIELLRIVQATLNAIPRTNLKHPDAKDSYQVASWVDRFLRNYGGSG